MLNKLHKQVYKIPTSTDILEDNGKSEHKINLVRWL